MSHSLTIRHLRYLSFYSRKHGWSPPTILHPATWNPWQMPERHDPSLPLIFPLFLPLLQKLCLGFCPMHMDVGCGLFCFLLQTESRRGVQNPVLLRACTWEQIYNADALAVNAVSSKVAPPVPLDNGAARAGIIVLN